MRKLHCCFFLKTRPGGEALRDDTRNHKHTHLVLLPMKSQRVMLTKQLRQLKTSTGAVTQRKHQLYKRTKSNSAHRPSISLGRMRASFPLVSTIERCKHCAVRARKLSPSFCVTLAADFSPHVITYVFGRTKHEACAIHGQRGKVRKITTNTSANANSDWLKATR